MKAARTTEIIDVVEVNIPVDQAEDLADELDGADGAQTPRLVEAIRAALKSKR